jgi:hypothetical protein
MCVVTLWPYMEMLQIVGGPHVRDPRENPNLYPIGCAGSCQEWQHVHVHAYGPWSHPSDHTWGPWLLHQIYDSQQVHVTSMLSSPLLFLAHTFHKSDISATLSIRSIYFWRTQVLNAQNKSLTQFEFLLLQLFGSCLLNQSWPSYCRGIHWLFILGSAH